MTATSAPGVSEQPPPLAPANRLPHLDALRGYAILLGVVLHAAVPWVPYVTTATDPIWSVVWPLVLAAVHGFRMPLFFLLSGFFTAMLWRRRGLGSLAVQRLTRVAAPLGISLVTVVPGVGLGIGLGYAVLHLGGHDAGAALGTVTVEERLAELEAELAPPPGDAATRGLPDTRPPTIELGLDLAHLWFLWQLLLLVAGFVLVALLLQRLRLPEQVARVALWATIPATLVPMYLMPVPGFGPSTDTSVLPDPAILLYYACFFAFGALVHERHHRGSPLVTTLGARWGWLLAASAVSFVAGLVLLEAVGWAASVVVQVGYAYVATFALMGLFAKLLARERFWVRYLSDASYWIYLVHLGLIAVLQGVVTLAPLPAGVRFALVTLTVTAICLVSYHYLVRYTPVGTLLNGRRTRAADHATRARLAARDG